MKNVKRLKTMANLYGPKLRSLRNSPTN